MRVDPDLRVPGFTLGVTTLTVLLFGPVPAVRGTRLELTHALKEGCGVVGGPLRNRLARGLIVGRWPFRWR